MSVHTCSLCLTQTCWARNYKDPRKDKTVEQLCFRSPWSLAPFSFPLSLNLQRTVSDQFREHDLGDLTDKGMTVSISLAMTMSGMLCNTQEGLSRPPRRPVQLTEALRDCMQVTRHRLLPRKGCPWALLEVKTTTSHAAMGGQHHHATQGKVPAAPAQPTVVPPLRQTLALLCQTQCSTDLRLHFSWF